MALIIIIIIVECLKIVTVFHNAVYKVCESYNDRLHALALTSLYNNPCFHAGVPAPSVSGPILVPSSPPYPEAVSEPAGASGMDSEHSSPQRQLPMQFSASVYNM